ncbi:MAG: UvrB/UvrC motif-containing protein [bacterium]|nr:UvrB/UvrC motif-containing protein [bacterium]
MPLNIEKFKYLNIKDIERLPNATGIYCFKQNKNFLYIGKAIDIKNRVKNHIQQPTFKDNVFLPQTEKIGFMATGSEIEALILEATLIKKYQPKYNTIWRDNKSHSYVFITNENFPRVFVGHQKKDVVILSEAKDLGRDSSALPQNDKLNIIGPFVDGRALRQTLRILRRIFPFRTCNKIPKKACLYKDLKLCPAPCLDYEKKCSHPCRSARMATKKSYAKNIKNLVEILQGQKNSVVKNLQKEMRLASQKQNFEKANEIKNQIFALENVFSHGHVLSRETLGIKTKIKRIEGYDVSNIQGQEATGSMVVFENGKPNKNEYRKFKIKITGKPNDTAMLKEVISRRLKHKEWALPQVMLIDGGIGQLNIALKLKTENEKLKNTKIISLAKRNNELFIEGKDKPVLLKDLPQEVSNLILQIRDEAHRFAITYHKTLRKKSFFN